MSNEHMPSTSIVLTTASCDPRGGGALGTETCPSQAQQPRMWTWSSGSEYEGATVGGKVGHIRMGQEARQEGMLLRRQSRPQAVLSPWEQTESCSDLGDSTDQT